MKTRRVILAASFLAINSGWGTVALNFNASFERGVPSGLATSSGVVKNGLIWGVLIDTEGNGIRSYYDAPNFALGAKVILSDLNVTTDDVFYVATTTTLNTSGDVEPGPDGSTYTVGGDGGIYDINNIGMASDGVNSGDRFHLVWLDDIWTWGRLGGVLSDPSFILPADGSVFNFDLPFVGVDPVRSAGQSYSGTQSQPIALGGIQFGVPEPTTALLGTLSAFGLLRRRRVS